MQVFNLFFESHNISSIFLKKELEYDFRCFYFTVPRPLLYRVIDYRCEKFVEDGLFKVGIANL